MEAKFQRRIRRSLSVDHEEEVDLTEAAETGLLGHVQREEGLEVYKESKLSGKEKTVLIWTPILSYISLEHDEEFKLQDLLL